MIEHLFSKKAMWWAFMPRGEMRRVLEQVYLTGLQLMIGCNTFSKTQVRKLARWAGVRQIVR